MCIFIVATNFGVLLKRSLDDQYYWSIFDIS